MPVARESFADRAYQDDGTLAPRSLPGALHHDPERVVAQVRELLGGRVTTLAAAHNRTASRHDLPAGDTPGALEFARGIRELLIREGYTISAKHLVENTKT